MFANVQKWAGRISMITVLVQPPQSFVRLAATVRSILYFSLLPLPNNSHVYPPAERLHSFMQISFHQGQEQGSEPSCQIYHIQLGHRIWYSAGGVNNMQTPIMCQENNLEHKVTVILWIKSTQTISRIDLASRPVNIKHMSSLDINICTPIKGHTGALRCKETTYYSRKTGM